jgi:aspartate carbamoyltransferase regulatory subunit
MIIDKISEGIVIDHIKAGTIIEIAYLLKLSDMGQNIAIVTNAESRKIGRKDILKICNGALSADLKDVLSLLIPGATVNIIENETVVNHYKIEAPRVGQIFTKFLKCRNPRCVTNKERDVVTKFVAKIYSSWPDKTYLKCIYCESEELFEPNKMLFINRDKPFVILPKQEG